MGVIDFNALPDSARIWIYGMNVPLHSEQVSNITEQMNRFLPQWTAHKRELSTAWILTYNRFLMIGADESIMTASGCSIDKLIKHLLALEQSTGVEMVNSASKIFYRDRSGNIECVSRPAFKVLVNNGAVDEKTVVFNNVIQSVAELRNGKWEVPMRNSWHFKAFPVGVFASE